MNALRVSKSSSPEIAAGLETWYLVPNRSSWQAAVCTDAAQLVQRAAASVDFIIPGHFASQALRSGMYNIYIYIYISIYIFCFNLSTTI